MKCTSVGGQTFTIPISHGKHGTIGSRKFQLAMCLSTWCTICQQPAYHMLRVQHFSAFMLYTVYVCTVFCIIVMHCIVKMMCGSAIRLKRWRNETVGHTIMCSKVLNLHQPKKALPSKCETYNRMSLQVSYLST